MSTVNSSWLGSSLLDPTCLEVLAHKPGAQAGATAMAQVRASRSFTATYDQFWASAPWR